MGMLGHAVHRRGLRTFVALVLVASTSAGLIGWAPGQARAGFAYIGQFGTAGSADGQLSNPWALAVDSSGQLLVADTGNNRIQRFAAYDSGTPLAFLSKITSVTGATPTNLTGPRGVTVDASGNLYISDSGANRILKLNSGGTLQWELDPGTGTAPGRVNDPHHLYADSTYLWEADTGRDRIQQFRLSDAGFIDKYGQGTQLAGPVGVAVDATMTAAWVGNPGRQDVIYYPYSGGALTSNAYRAIPAAAELPSWPSGGTASSADGYFSNPRGVAVDRQGWLYVADTDNNRIQVFRGDRTFVGKFGTSGTGNGQFNRPTAVAVDAAGRVYVLDQGNNRVQVFMPDFTAPVTTTNAPAGWQGSAVSVTLTGSDPGGSGVAATYYRLNGGAQTAYSTPINVSSQGVNTIEYWSVDNAANEETHKVVLVRVDTSPPVTTDDAPSGWLDHSVTVELDASDAYSGVDET